jgi:hypothetical protein
MLAEIAAGVRKNDVENNPILLALLHTVVCVRANMALTCQQNKVIQNNISETVGV